MEDRRPTLAEELLLDVEAGQAPPPPPPRARMHPLLLGGALVLVAINLRPALASLAPILPEIMHDLGISVAAASLLTTAPVLCLGVAAPVAPPLARRLGAERVILACLLLLVAGTALRGIAAYPALLGGSIVAGLAIGVIGALLPGIVKRDFPERPQLLTGIYTTALGVGAAGAAGLTVPLERLAGGHWPVALVEWAVPAVLAAVLWWPFLPAKAAGPKVPVVAARGLWRDPLAWQVTAFMAQVSTSFYSVLAWFPLIMRDRGETPASAGLLMAVMMMMQLVFSLACPLMASWGRDQRLLTVVMCLATVAGTAGCIFMPMSGIWLWALVLGAGQGGIFGIALSFLVLRAPDGRVAAQLSGMAQGVGYLIACAGPMAIGLLRQHTGDWRAGGVLLVVVGLGMLLAGLGAGRDRHVLAGRAD